jgi:hypothetical protein
MQAQEFIPFVRLSWTTTDGKKRTSDSVLNRTVKLICDVGKSPSPPAQVVAAALPLPEAVKLAKKVDAWMMKENEKKPTSAELLQLKKDPILLDIMARKDDARAQLLVTIVHQVIDRLENTPYPPMDPFPKRRRSETYLENHTEHFWHLCCKVFQVWIQKNREYLTYNLSVSLDDYKQFLHYSTGDQPYHSVYLAIHQKALDLKFFGFNRLCSTIFDVVVEHGCVR